MRNKIGVLCTYAFPEGMAPTIRILSYGQGLVNNGCQVEVVIFQPKVQDDSYPLSGLVNGVKYSYAHKRDKSRPTWYKLFVDRPKSLFNAIKILRKSNSEKRFDCILLSFDHPLFLLFFVPILKILGFKLGFIGDEFPEPIRKLKSSIPYYYKVAYKIVYRFISFRILMTEALRDYYNTEVCKKPTHILCSILNTDRFKSITRRHVNHKYLCYMGNMQLAKDNVDNIIKAFSFVCNDFPDIDLYLYGTPSDNDKSLIIKLISDLGLTNRIFLKGRVDYNLVPQILANAEILLTSQPITKRAAGGFPTKLAEYMMSKTPSIVTNVGEIANYVSNGVNIYMVEPCDACAYASKIKYILDNPKEAQVVAENAYRYALANFSSTKITLSLLDFLKGQCN